MPFSISSKISKDIDSMWDKYKNSSRIEAVEFLRLHTGQDSLPAHKSVRKNLENVS